MPQLNVPLGSQINQTEDNSIQIKIHNTKFWILGEKKDNHKWDAYLFDPRTNYKEILRKDTSTKSFALFSNIILKTPFPYIGKRYERSSVIKKFIKKLTTKKHAPKRKRQRIRS